jgi:predicted kinase
MELIIFMGQPASGKTAYFEKHFAGTHTRISSEDGKKQRARMEETFGRRGSVVADHGNATIAERTEWIQVARMHGATVKGIIFRGSTAGPNWEEPRFEEAFDQLTTIG